MSFPINVNADIVLICDDVYCKTPEALEDILNELSNISYNVEDLRQASDWLRGGFTPEEMEATPRALWFCHLNSISRGKCKSCFSLIDTAGIQSHGHVCEVCGDPTYLKIVRGSRVYFSFLGDDCVQYGSALNMEAKRWDAEEGWLYLKYRFLPGTAGVVTGEKAQAYLDRHTDQFEVIEENGERLLKVHLENDIYRSDDDVINVIDIQGSEHHHRRVKLRDSGEYEYHYPFPSNIYVYETWRWAPLTSSPNLHECLIHAVYQYADMGYYHEGVATWSPQLYAEMGKFVRHFTRLDADDWDRLSRNFSLYGAHGVVDVANFCHPQPHIENNLSVDNFLYAISDLQTGRRLHTPPLTADREALADDPLIRMLTRHLVQNWKLNRSKNAKANW